MSLSTINVNPTQLNTVVIENSKFKIQNFDTQKGGIFATLFFQHSYECASTNTHSHLQKLTAFTFACQSLNYHQKQLSGGVL